MSKSTRFRVRFWGVRGSYPTPGPHTVRYGGNTTCVEIEAGTHTLILDAGSGIIRLGDDLLRRTAGQNLDIALFLTHGHGDHLIGLPFFAPLYEPTTHIAFFAPCVAGRNVEQLVTPLLSPPYFPVDMRNLPSQRTFHTLNGTEHIAWTADEHAPTLTSGRRHTEGEAVRILVHLTNSHPLNGSAVYRIEYAGRRLVFATDVEWREHGDPAFLAFIKGADVLIHDAQYTPDEYRDRQGFGHSSTAMATEVAAEACVGKLVLFHHEPTYNDDKLDALQEEARRHFARTFAAYEGMEIDL